MAKRVLGGVTMKLDERSIRSFKKNVDALIYAEGEYAKEDIADFCDEVLKLSNQLVPVDTGTLAESAGYKITKKGNGYSARMGYGVTKNPVNPRTGKRASSYAGEVHENYHFTESDGVKANGQGKFFEKALYQYTEDFYRRNKESLRELLTAPTFTARRGGTKRFKTQESKDKYYAYMNRLSSGFTARHGGRILPYPLNGGKVKTGRVRTFKTAQSVRAKSNKKFSYNENVRGRNYESRGAAARRRAVVAKSKTNKHIEDLKEDFKYAHSKGLIKKY